MSGNKPHWKTIKELFSSLKKQNIQKDLKIAPVLAVYSSEPVKLRAEAGNIFNIDTKGSEYVYLLNVFKFKEIKTYYRCCLEVEIIGRDEDENANEEKIYGQDELDQVAAFITIPNRLFNITNKKKKVITFKDIELDFKEYIRFINIWKKEKMT
jgi:hypothetical protein